MNSRERVKLAISHKKTDKTPFDLGGTQVTGICASIYSQLKRALGITTGEIKVFDTHQMLAEIEEEVRSILGIDTISIRLPYTTFGYKTENWKPFKMFDGTRALVPNGFVYDILENGDIVQYPKGDKSVPPSGKMPKNGYYFDVIIRQEPIDENSLDPKEWVEQNYSLYTDEDLQYLEKTSKWFFNNTNYSLVGNFWGAGFGDIAKVVGAHIVNPKGIRDPEEWYISLITRKSYIKEIFSKQLELQLRNLQLFKQAVGDRIDVITMSATDFGTQNSTIISPELYRELFKPFYKVMNDWVHKNTPWKTFYHSCGSNITLLDDFIEAGIDILNPVQINAKGMDPYYLKKRFGNKLVFWGGGINAQKTLPFGKSKEVTNEVKNNIKIFRKNSGYVFSFIHNIQCNVPIDNLLAALNAFKEVNRE